MSRHPDPGLHLLTLQTERFIRSGESTKMNRTEVRGKSSACDTAVFTIYRMTVVRRRSSNGDPVPRCLYCDLNYFMRSGAQKAVRQRRYWRVPGIFYLFHFWNLGVAFQINYTDVITTDTPPLTVKCKSRAESVTRPRCVRLSRLFRTS